MSENGSVEGIFSYLFLFAAGQRILLEMWREKSASPMHAIHMGFGIGALSAPLIANPFLAVLKFSPPNSTEPTMTTIKYGSETYYVVEESNVHLAYVTIGVISFVLSLPFFIYPLIKCIKRRQCNSEYYNVEDDNKMVDTMPKNLKQLINPATYAAGSLKYGLFVFIWLLVYFINVVGGEQLFGNFIRTFSVDQLKFPREEASFLDTTFWGSFTIGRFLGAVLSHCIDIKILFPIDAVLNLIAVTFLDIFSTNSHATLWIFTAIVGLTIGPLFPAAISYANTQIQVGGVVLTLVVFSVGVGDFLYIWLTGHLYDAYGPRSVLYAEHVSATLVFLLAVLFLICGHFHGNRFNKESYSEEFYLGEYTRLGGQITPISSERRQSKDAPKINGTQ